MADSRSLSLGDRSEESYTARLRRLPSGWSMNLAGLSVAPHVGTPNWMYLNCTTQITMGTSADLLKVLDYAGVDRDLAPIILAKVMPRNACKPAIAA